MIIHNAGKDLEKLVLTQIINRIEHRELKLLENHLTFRIESHENVTSEKVILLLRLNTRLSKYFLQSPGALQRSPKASGGYERGRRGLDTLPHDNKHSLFHI